MPGHLVEEAVAWLLRVLWAMSLYFILNIKECYSKYKRKLLSGTDWENDMVQFLFAKMSLWLWWEEWIRMNKGGLGPASLETITKMAQTTVVTMETGRFNHVYSYSIFSPDRWVMTTSCLPQYAYTTLA